MFWRAFFFVVFAGTIPTAGESCAIKNAGAKCVEAKALPESVRRARAEQEESAQGFGVGDILPRGKYFMLMNSQRYGLPPASGGLLYFRAEQQVLRVDLATMEVREDVTSLLTRKLP